MRILVTGGGGFLGQALCRRLAARGYTVSSFSRRYYQELETLRVTQIQGDLAEAGAIMNATRGIDAVFHNAAKAGAWGSYSSYYRANVTGTENVIAACHAHGITRMVYTSTPSVTHRATHPVEGGTADHVPYGERLKAPYAQTKRIAEEMVLAANSTPLSTIALRPRLIWGPGDKQLLPKLVERAKSGRLRLVGGGHNLIDTTYIDNAVDAHLAAFDHLKPEAACAGRAYFISNGEPRPLREIINALLKAAGAPPVHASIPFPLAYLIGAVCEGAWPLLKLKGEPPLTRFLAEQLHTTHWYSMEPARQDFGYEPKISIEEGLRRLQESNLIS